MTMKARFRSYAIYLNKKIFQTRLRNKYFTIISNNCWGGEVYKNLGIPYQSPFIGLFMFAPCYIQLLNNLQKLVKSKLSFIKISKYHIANEYRTKGVWSLYPIGQLNGEIEIHFMHYKSEAEAKEKWIRRSQRINWDNQDSMLFKFCDRGLCTKQLIEEFDQLKLYHKVCFTSKNYPEFPSTIWIEECKNDDCVVDGGSLYKVCRKYFDVIDWLNGGSGEIKVIQKIMNILLWGN